jgi:hypothetical protein
MTIPPDHGLKNCDSEKSKSHLGLWFTTLGWKQTANNLITKEEGPTDPFRSAPQNAETNKTELSTFVEESSIEISKTEGPNFSSYWPSTLTTPDQNLSTVLSRVYKYNNYTWSNSAGQGTIIYTLMFPYVCTQIPQIAEILSRYRFFRCKGVKVEIRMNSTIQHYGLLNCSTVLGSNSGTGYSIVDWVQRLNNDPNIISASQNEPLELVLPWTSEKTWLTYPFDDDANPSIGRMYLDIIAPLAADADSTSPVDITVYVSLIDPEVAGPIPIAAASLLDGYYDPRDLSRRIRLGYAVKKDQSGKGKRKSPEAVSKEDSILSTVKDGMNMLLEFGEIAGKVISVVGPIAALDKPSTMQPPNHAIMEFGRDMPHGSGLDGSVKMSFDPAAMLDNKAEILPGGERDMYALMRRPGFRDNGTITSAATIGSKVAMFAVHPTSSYYRSPGIKRRKYPTYMGWYTSLFKRWRGSIRYHFMFNCSRFTTCRLVMMWFPSGVIPPATIPADESGDILSVTCNITGDTEFDITIPWLHGDLYSPVTELGLDPSNIAERADSGYLAIYVVNRVLNADPGSTPQIPWFVWVSAGNDFQVSHLVGPPTINANIPFTDHPGSFAKIRNDYQVKEDQVRIWDTTTGPTQVLGVDLGMVESGMCTPENYGDIVELGKRYARWNGTPLAGGYLASPFPRSTHANTTNLQQWLMFPFRYMRGSVRWKLVDYANTQPFIEASMAANNYGRGGAYTINHISTPVATNFATYLEIEVPYYASTPYVKIDEPINDIDQVRVDPVTIFQFQSFGDDFGLFVAFSPPIFEQT